MAPASEAKRASADTAPDASPALLKYLRSLRKKLAAGETLSASDRTRLKEWTSIEIMQVGSAQALEKGLRGLGMLRTSGPSPDAEPDEEDELEALGEQA